MADDGAISYLLDKVSFVNKISLLVKATADDEKPTPGYMYKEIADVSLESGGHCQTLLSYLVARLNNSSYHVKLKVLRIMKFVVENGHPDFRQGLRRKSQGIQQATKFSGPPDPLHGMAPYEMIRKIAMELSQILFEISEEDAEVKAPEKPIYASGGMGSGTPAHSSMQGFGNTVNKPNKTLGESFMSGLQDLVEKVTDGGQPQHQLSTGPRCGDYKPVQVSLSMADSLEESTSVASETHNSRQVKKHRPGVAGGGWDDEEADSTQGSSTPSQSSDRTIELMPSNKADDWKAEENLVLNIIQQSSSFILARKDLETFVKACQGLNCDKVVEFVNRWLGEGNQDKTTMHCLMVVEVLIRTDLINIDHLTFICAENLINTYTTGSPQCSVKARKIIRQLQKLCTKSDVLKEMPAPSGEKKFSHNLLQQNIVQLESLSSSQMKPAKEIVHPKTEKTTNLLFAGLTLIDSLGDSSEVDQSLVMPFASSTDSLQKGLST